MRVLGLDPSSAERAYSVRLSEGSGDPRAYRSYPSVFGRYVRKRGRLSLSLEEIVRKMSGLPSQRFRLYDRGLIRLGMWADILVLDISKMSDEWDWENPRRYPEGFEYVLVNGQLVIEKSKHTGAAF